MESSLTASKTLPVIGITMGDPAGIGPEITALALSYPEVYSICRPIILGDLNIFKNACKLLKLNLQPRPVNSVEDGYYDLGSPEIINLSELNADNLIPGKPTKENGRAMLSYLDKGIKLAMDKEINGIATAPITKTALKMTGSKFHGHTELLAEATGTSDYNMMFIGRSLKIVLVTIHIPLSEVPEAINKENIFKTIKTTALTLKNRFNVTDPSLAVAGLNPHAGENSMFGNEERDIITPAVDAAKMAGFDVSGPIPPDTLFYTAVHEKRYDCIVCMYHDQGLIPFKLLHFDSGINTTIGLPIIRTSCDHGTAYDIAWKGKADPSSLVEAVKSAAFQAKSQI